MDWTGYPVSIAPDEPLAGLDELRLFLGGDTFTAGLLDLIAQATPENLDRLTATWPREVTAWLTWQSTNPTPTGAELVDALAALPDPVPPTPDTPLVPLEVDRVQIVRNTGGNTVTLSIKGRSQGAQAWRQWLLTVPSPAVGMDGSLFDGSRTDGLLTLAVQVPA